MGASLAFLVSRYLARRTLEGKIGGDPRLAAIDTAIRREGAKLIFLLRLSPAFPFTLMNYALGLTGVRFRELPDPSCFLPFPNRLRQQATEPEEDAKKPASPGGQATPTELVGGFSQCLSGGWIRED